MASAKQIITEIEWQPDVPPRFSGANSEEDTQFAARTPFTAFTMALDLGRHDKRLWNVIKGSPYEREYRRKFNPPD
jgi:hypothetical protein